MTHTPVTTSASDDLVRRLATRLAGTRDGVEYRVVVDVTGLDPGGNEAAFLAACHTYNRYVLNANRYVNGLCYLHPAGHSGHGECDPNWSENILGRPLDPCRIFVHAAAVTSLRGYFKTPNGIGLMVLASPKTNRHLLERAANLYGGTYQRLWGAEDFHRSAEIVLRHLDLFVLDPDEVLGHRSSVGIKELLSLLR